ncbi:MAG: S8 family serine peptidase [Muribaculaceae bacterium]|nr:S8 family serine peptidase [Muribaculaceae bacterium]
MSSENNDNMGFGFFWTIVLGLCLFAVIMAILMGLFGNHDYDRNPISRQFDPTDPSLPYPYNPTDPTEGGRFPSPQNPSLPITPLPPGQGGGTIYPIDPGDIIFDPGDSLITIVGNRINVLLEKENENTGKAFMSEFKRLYPQDDYAFIYFDTLSYRMQLKIPENKRQFLKDNLNAQMPEFDFLLFDEEVFGLSYNPSDPDFSSKSKSWYFDAINVPKAWNTTKGDSTIIVAVVDNGFDLNHPEFKGKIVKPMNIPERNTHIYPIIENDGTDHGTHVAATAIGGIDNGTGVSGIAPLCKFMPVQVATSDGTMLSTSIIDGILYAIYNGASVINVSLGPYVPDWFRALPVASQQSYISHQDQRLSKVWERIYEIADKHGCTIVVAAGNENVLSGFASKARNDRVIVVSAIDQNRNKADFSNYGDFPGWPTNYSTVSAPGVNIYNAINRNRYATMQGTSMASPVVAGSVALIKSINPKLNTKDIIQILKQSGLKLSDPVGPMIQLDKAITLAKQWKSNN